MVEGARDGRGTVEVVAIGDSDASDGNPWVISHGTHTHEYGYGFYVGAGMGGPKNTHGLPMMNPRYISSKSWPSQKWMFDVTRRGDTLLITLLCLQRYCVISFITIKYN